MTTDHPPQVEELLPCPFCGGEGDVSFYARPQSPDPAGHFVECLTCAAAGPSHEIRGDAPDRAEYAKAKAIDAWNTRLASTPQTSGELVNAVRFLLDRLIDHEVRMTSEEDAREWHGHVTPAMARLRALAAPGSSQPSDMIGEAVAAERERCARIAESEPRVWRSNAPDPQTRIAAAIRLPTATEGERS